MSDVSGASSTSRGDALVRWAHETDARHNAALATHGPYVLVLRMLRHQPDYNEHFLIHLRAAHPTLASRIECRRIGAPDIDLARYALIVPWLPAPFIGRFPAWIDWIRDLEARAAARGIPVINPLDSLANCAKLRGSAVLRDHGLPAPHAAAIDDELRFRNGDFPVEVPLIVRQDLEHVPPIRLVRSEAERASVRLDDVAHPIATEFVDVRNDDGMVRKYRYIVAGEYGIPRHLVISRHWMVKAAERAFRAGDVDEEIAYLEAANPHHDLMLAARRALGLDVVTFDYSIRPDGTPVIWEANARAVFWAPFNEAPIFSYQRPYVARLYDRLARYYAEQAGFHGLAISVS